jgi:hypothetical protein
MTMNKTNAYFIFLAAFCFLERAMYWGIKYSLMPYFLLELKLSENEAVSLSSSINYYLPIFISILAVLFYYTSMTKISLAICASLYLLASFALSQHWLEIAMLSIAAASACFWIGLFSQLVKHSQPKQVTWSIAAKLLLLVFLINLGAFLSTIAVGIAANNYTTIFILIAAISLVLSSVSLYYCSEEPRRTVQITILGVGITIGCFYFIDLQSLLPEDNDIWVYTALVGVLIVLYRAHLSRNVILALFMITLISFSGLSAINQVLITPLMSAALALGLKQQLFSILSLSISSLLAPISIIGLIIMIKSLQHQMSLVVGFMSILLIALGALVFAQASLFSVAMISIAILIIAESLYIFPMSLFLRCIKVESYPIVFAIYFLLDEIGQHWSEYWTYDPAFLQSLFSGSQLELISLDSIGYLLPLLGSLIVSLVWFGWLNLNKQRKIC